MRGHCTCCISHVVYMWSQVDTHTIRPKPYQMRFFLPVVILRWIWAWLSMPCSRAALAMAASPECIPAKAMLWLPGFEFLRCKATVTSSKRSQSLGRGQSWETFSSKSKHARRLWGLLGGVVWEVVWSEKSSSVFKKWEKCQVRDFSYVCRGTSGFNDTGWMRILRLHLRRRSFSFRILQRRAML